MSLQFLLDAADIPCLSLALLSDFRASELACLSHAPRMHHACTTHAPRTHHACRRPQGAHSRCQASRRHSPDGYQCRRRHSACCSVRFPNHPPYSPPFHPQGGCALPPQGTCVSPVAVLDFSGIAVFNLLYGENHGRARKRKLGDYNSFRTISGRLLCPGGVMC